MRVLTTPSSDSGRSSPGRADPLQLRPGAQAAPVNHDGLRQIRSFLPSKRGILDYVDAAPDPSDSLEVDDEVDLAEVDGEPIPPEPLVAYQFDAADVSVAVAVVDAAFATNLDGFLAASAITDAASAHNLPKDSPLVRELVLAASYQLHHEPPGRPGCSLGPAAGEGAAAWPPPIRSVEQPVVELWRALASAVTEPAAIARFEDLLFCRRDGNGLAHATRAAEAYLDAAQGDDMDMDAVEAIVRAWTLARSVRQEVLEGRIRERLAEVADDVLTNLPGERPGVVLPMLGALAEGPLRADQTRKPDPINVDDLLTRAAAVFSRGHIATEVARYRRARTQQAADHELIARDEVAAYFREAEGAATPAVRMHHLEAAARVARGRGLPELVREATSQMQRIKPSELGLQRITAAGSLPRYVPESWLRQFTRSPDWRDGMRWFLAGDPPSGDVQRLKDYEESTRGGLRRIFASTALSGEGLPLATTDGDEDQAAHEMSFMARISAENIGRMAAEGLRRISERYGLPEEDDLVELFVHLGGRDVGIARSLAKAFRHFWQGDYESCVHVAAPKFEAAARNLLRELDEGVYRVQAGKDPGGYPGLYVLLDELEKLALDESWAYFFRWLLLGPYGANVRNDVAHGFVTDISPIYAALTLRAVSVLVTVSGPPVIGKFEPDAAIDADAAVEPARAREEVLRLLAAPVGIGGWIDRPTGWLARQLDRGWWMLQTVRARAKTRHRRRS